MEESSKNPQAPFFPSTTVMGLGDGSATPAPQRMPQPPAPPATAQMLPPPPPEEDFIRTRMQEPKPCVDDDDAETTVRPQPNWEHLLAPGIGPWPGASAQRYRLPESNPPPAMTLPLPWSPPPKPPTGGGIGKVGIALLATMMVVCAGIGALVLRPQKGGLSIDLAVEGGASVPEVEIFVDGHKACQSVPCTLDGLAAGPRLVQVVAPGFIAPDASAEPVEAGKQKPLVIPVRPAPQSTGFKVTGSQPGVKVYVDGSDQGPLPARVVELAPGTHRLRFSGGERYVSLDRTVDVLGGRIADMGEVRLPVRLGRITVDVATPGARVLIVRDGARKAMRGPWPMTLDVDATQGWKLLATAPGHKDLVQPLTFADGQPLQTIKIDLPKR